MGIKSLKDIATASQAELQEIFKEYKLFTLKMDKNIAKYLGYENPEFITAIRDAIDSYKWIEIKKAQDKELTIEKHIFIENIAKVTTSIKQNRQKEEAAELENNQDINTEMIIDSVENLKRKRDSEDISKAFIARKKKRKY